MVISAFFLMKAFSQAPEIEWQNTIGANNDDELLSIDQTSDGGYILGGYTPSGLSGDKTEASLGLYDYWVVKLNSAGTIQWQNTIGGSSDDLLFSIQQTSDDGYIIGGCSNSVMSGDKTEGLIGDYDYWVIKLNDSGAIEWQNTIGGSDKDALFSIQQTTDGGYILGGDSYSGISGDKTEPSLGNADYWVVKLNSTGAIQWQNTIGGSEDDHLYCLQQTSDDGYILGGYSNSGLSGDKTEASLGDYDYWVVKLNNIGALEWQNTIGGSHYDQLYSIQETSDGEYIVGGYSLSGISGDKTEPSLGSADYWVVKLKSNGVIKWQNTIGGSSADDLYSVQQTSDGGYVLGGYSFSDISGDKTEASLGNYDYWVVKLNSTGTIQWQNTIGGSGIDHLRSIQQTSDGGYILGGDSWSGISGDKTEASSGGYDYWVVKLYPFTCNFPSSFSITGITSSSAKLTWVAVGSAEGYKVRYKVANTADWTTKNTLNNFKKINNLSPSTEYVWQVKTVCTITPNLSSNWSANQYFTTNSLRPEGEITAETFEVYPNPFSSSTTITFSIEKSQNIIIELFDIAGRKLETLLDENLEAGSHEIHLDRGHLPAGLSVLKRKTLSSVTTQSIIIQ